MKQAPVVCLIGTVCGLMMHSPALALPDFLTAWQSRYGAVSPIDDNNITECQICHVSTNGGNGWNGYGWRIRQLLNDGVTRPTIDEALIQAGVNDGDLDEAGAFSITEIVNGHHPGWRDGNRNTHFFENGGTQTNQSPPSDIANEIDLDPAPSLDDPIPAGISRGDLSVSLETVADGFISPLLAIPAPGVDDVLFVVDQVGIIWRVSLIDGSKTIFFDISKNSTRPEGMNSGLVDVGNAGFGAFDERGLLGLAFHPDYASNGLFYTYQSEELSGTADFSTMPEMAEANHQTVIAEWSNSAPLEPSASVTKREVLRIDQPQFNHNGGMLAFDNDGLLYIALGDGGARDDEDLTTEEPNNTTRVRVVGHGSGNGSDLSNPLGAILRIDPTARTSSNGQYGVPNSNPFDGSSTELAEIFAYGLRNPYRFSFDSETGELYAGDVGQGDIEEINIIEAGKDYGWNHKEGSFWFYPNFRQDGYVSDEAPTPLPTGLTDPALQYDHDEGISVTGGYVYRGSDVPELDGVYIFADWSKDFSQPLGRLFYSEDQSTIKEFRLAGQPRVGLFITGFGQDSQGEVYVLGNTRGVPLGRTGVLQKIVPAVEEEQVCIPIKAANESVAVICL